MPIMSSPSSNIKLTDEQNDAIHFLKTSTKQVRILGGLAGCGKTTLVKELVRQLPNCNVCAFTGKAAQVLRSKGTPASTIHSLIYAPSKDPDTGKVTFSLRAPWEFAAQGIIVDEASMVPRKIYDDLLSFGVPVIFIGDHGQLEPVGGEDFNLMAKPDVTLETIHRNAGEIAKFAEHLRRGGEAKDWEEAKVTLGIENEGKVEVIRADGLGDLSITEDDQMICAFNRTRCDMNSVVRRFLGKEDGAPQVGDRVICLQNSRAHALFNGMMGTIQQIYPTRKELVFESGDYCCRVGYNPEAFGAEKKPDHSWNNIPFDWAYCITAHKSQGSEYDHAIVIEQRCSKWSHQRWAYTAASRAKNKLTWVLS